MRRDRHCTFWTIDELWDIFVTVKENLLVLEGISISVLNNVNPFPQHYLNLKKNLQTSLSEERESLNKNLQKKNGFTIFPHLPQTSCSLISGGMTIGFLR